MPRISHTFPFREALDERRHKRLFPFAKESKAGLDGVPFAAERQHWADAALRQRFRPIHARYSMAPRQPAMPSCECVPVSKRSGRPSPAGRTL